MQPYNLSAYSELFEPICCTSDGFHFSEKKRQAKKPPNTTEILVFSSFSVMESGGSYLIVLVAEVHPMRDNNLIDRIQRRAPSSAQLFHLFAKHAARVRTFESIAP